jgi:very-short-patch-repair endonuclease
MDLLLDPVRLSDRRHMNEELRALLVRHGGVVRRDEVAPGALKWASHTGEVRRLLPGVWVDATLARQPATLHRAAVRYADGRGALSHTTALDAWGLRPADPDEPVHISVPFGVRLRSHPPVVVHQRRDLRLEPPDVVVRAGVPVTRLETTLVDAWPLLPPEQRPAPMIRAVSDRRTTAERILTALETVPRLGDRAAIRVLLDRLAGGCHSALEIWGHDHVFTGPGMPPFERQVRVRLGGQTFYLDIFARAERVDFELDGAASHGAPEQREADLRRDARLAAHGIQVVRFTHRRLLHDTDAVRREILDVLAAARRRGAA